VVQVDGTNFAFQPDSVVLLVSDSTELLIAREESTELSEGSIADFEVGMAVQGRFPAADGFPDIDPLVIPATRIVARAQ